MKRLSLLLVLLPLCSCIDDWQPVLQPELYHGSSKTSFPIEQSYSSLVAQRYQPTSIHGGGQCELYKVGFTQDLYFQYIQYKNEIPEMKEFTLCMWTKFTNHTNDHPLFSYAVDGQPRAIYSWISNTDRSSYFSLAVEGHTFYRLNYPLRLNRWYHSCQSWNGRTGEWQIWVNAERVGRGFHNRLVGHSVPSGGIAITGQEQTQTGGGFLEGKDAPQGSGGMLGEVTMVQLYHVALTAGKAHKDHKHHHAHKFDHNGTPITTTPSPTAAPRPNQASHPLLTGGQLNPNVALNIAAQQQLPVPQVVQGQSFNAQLLNGQFLGSLVSQQLSQANQAVPQQSFGPQQIPQQFPPGPTQFQSGPQQLIPRQRPQRLQLIPSTSSEFSYGQSGISQGSPLINSGLVHSSLTNPANVQIIDNTQIETHSLFKRQNEGEASVATKESAEESIEAAEDSAEFGKKKVSKRETKEKTDSKHKKRELFLSGGSLIDDSLLSNSFDQSLLDGLAGIGQNEPVLQKQKQSDEREPAEAEVKAVMSLCSGCGEEPFGKALVFGWRTVPKKLYSGAFYTPAVPECRVF